MGKVYKVKHPVIKQISALKLLSPAPLLLKLVGESTLKNMFIAEAQIMAEMRHPNVVKVLYYDVYCGWPYYVMDYHCLNMADLIGEGKITETPSRMIRVDKAYHYTKQILNGLARLHDANIIHRDIKPFNILISHNDVAQICDFGLSKLRGDSFASPDQIKIGTPYYAAPEQETHPDDVDETSDLYAVGVMLFRMLAGRLPCHAFDGTIEHPDEQTELISTINSEVDSEWDYFFQKSLHTKPSMRFQTATEMKVFLTQLYDNWVEQQEQTCQLEAPLKIKEEEKQSDNVLVRREAVKLRGDQARHVFGLNKTWRPNRFINNDFHLQGQNDVYDKATGLRWQQSGSSYPMTWDQACLYIAQLNNTRGGGGNQWRIPTIAELITLITKSPHQLDFCTPEIFDANKKWLWSCDRYAFNSCWYVNMEVGSVGWHDRTGLFFIKGVCSIANKE